LSCERGLKWHCGSLKFLRPSAAAATGADVVCACLCFEGAPWPQRGAVRLAGREVDCAQNDSTLCGHLWEKRQRLISKRRNSLPRRGSGGGRGDRRESLARMISAVSAATPTKSTRSSRRWPRRGYSLPQMSPATKHAEPRPPQRGPRSVTSKAWPNGLRSPCSPSPRMSGDPDQAYSSDGITRTSVTELSRFPSCSSSPANRAFRDRASPSTWRR